MKFLSANWYKLMMSCSSLIFAVAILIYAIKTNTALAKDLPSKINNTTSDVFAVSDGRSAFIIKWDQGIQEGKIIYTIPLH
ncbi:hypothetical protein [Pinibacter soli]|uniref:Uncharacterized protein n=1 Tax=Pinibacter soli TaxID=3044211 RepID=A0ABT6RDY0_9BACT|nr:hypothetical protein [Pinibacter soli]MDI3320783.1 hypothetical protein [Pinibacter soli]